MAETKDKSAQPLPYLTQLRNVIDALTEDSVIKQQVMGDEPLEDVSASEAASIKAAMIQSLQATKRVSEAPFEFRPGPAERKASLLTSTRELPDRIPTGLPPWLGPPWLPTKDEKKKDDK